MLTKLISLNIYKLHFRFSNAIVMLYTFYDYVNIIQFYANYWSEFNKFKLNQIFLSLSLCIKRTNAE